MQFRIVQTQSAPKPVQARSFSCMPPTPATRTFQGHLLLVGVPIVLMLLVLLPLVLSVGFLVLLLVLVLRLVLLVGVLVVLVLLVVQVLLVLVLLLVLLLLLVVFLLLPSPLVRRVLVLLLLVFVLLPSPLMPAASAFLLLPCCGYCAFSDHVFPNATRQHCSPLLLKVVGGWGAILTDGCSGGHRKTNRGLRISSSLAQGRAN